MTVVNPKSISGITSITTASGSDDLLTIHTNNGTERLRVDSTGATKIVTGIVTTLTATTGIVTTLTANTVTSLGAVSGTSGTFTGGIDVTSNVTISDSIVHSGDTDSKIRFPAADTITAETGGTERIRINSDGRIAINDTGLAAYTTYSPCLAIGDSGDSTPGLVLRGSTSSNCDISFCDNSGAESDDGVSEGLIRYEHSNDAMVFHTADEERARITSDGKIGVNVTTPQKLLDVRGEFAISNSNTSYWDFDRDDSDGSLKIKDTGTERFRIATGGDVTVLTGNLVIGTSGKGIDFSATSDTASGTMSSELLDDYEEGTFSPAFKAENNSSNATTNVNEVGYTKVGNLVYFRFFITLTSHASGTTGGSAYINGLPFTSSNGHSAVHIGYFATWAQNQTFVTATMQPSSNQILLRHYTSAAASTSNMDYDNNLQPNSKVIISGCYQAA